METKGRGKNSDMEWRPGKGSWEAGLSKNLCALSLAAEFISSKIKPLLLAVSFAVSTYLPTPGLTWTVKAGPLLPCPPSITTPPLLLLRNPTDTQI